MGNGHPPTARMLWTIAASVVASFGAVQGILTWLMVPAIMETATERIDAKIALHDSQGPHDGGVTAPLFEAVMNGVKTEIRAVREQNQMQFEELSRRLASLEKK